MIVIVSTFVVLGGLILFAVCAIDASVFLQHDDQGRRPRKVKG